MLPPPRPRALRQRGLYRNRGVETRNDVGACDRCLPYLMAVSFLVTLPIIIAFFFAQRTFIEGISLTGVKG